MRFSGKTIRLAGVLSFVIGIIFLIHSFSGITGFIIHEELNKNTSSILGAVFILIGIILLSARRDYEYGLRSRDSLRIHNEEAHYAARETFRRQYHHNPNKEELKKFIRKYHERGWLGDLVDAFR